MIPEPPVWEFLGWVVIGGVSLLIAYGVIVGGFFCAGLMVGGIQAIRAKWKRLSPKE